MSVDHPADRGVALQRADGAVRLRFGRRGDVTALAELHQRTPCRVLFPTPEAGDPVQAVLLTTTGGLTGGDRVAVSIGAGAGAVACVTTQAAEKIYRSTGADCTIAVELAVEEGAWLEWLPQETILFDRARLRRRTEVRLAAGGRLLAVEIVLFGRAARGESLDAGLLHDAWAIRRPNGLVWADAVHLAGDIAALRRAPYGFNTAAGYATVLYAGADAAHHLAAARELVAGCGVEGGASCVGDVLLMRFLAGDGARLRAAAGRTVCGLRAALAGLPARMPRVWDV